MDEKDQKILLHTAARMANRGSAVGQFNDYAFDNPSVNNAL
jgi:hypothetical protein